MRKESSSENKDMHRFMAAPPSEQVATLRAWGLPPAVALILLNSCEARCFFCANRGTISVSSQDTTGWPAIAARLEAPVAGVTRLLIGGNDPCLHRDFDRIMALAHKVGYRTIEVMTSGFQLANLGRLDAWVAHGLTDLAIPIYGTYSALHDKITGTPTFDRLVQGLDAAHARGVRLHLHTLALQRNAHDLATLAQMAETRWGSRLAIAPLREKAELFAWEREALSFAEINAWLDTLPASANIALLGYPLCVGRGRPRGSAQVIEMYFRTQQRVRASVCDGCIDDPVCDHVIEAELARHGSAGLRPRVKD